MTRAFSVGARRVFAALALLLAPPPLPASDCEGPKPKLTLRVDDVAPKQGSVAALVLESDRELADASLSDGKREIALEAGADGRSFRLLYGVDFEAKAGPRVLKVEARDECGAHAVSRTVEVRPARFATQTLRVDPGFVEVPPAERARVEADRERVARVWAAPATARRWTAAFRSPVPTQAGGSFGARRVFNGKTKSRHNGVDLPGKTGDPILAPAPATVALAADLYFSGGTVILDHGEGLFTTYFHMSRLDVREGDRLEPGQKIGAVGATGRATGSHLHWGARLNGARVNPLSLLRLPAWPAPD